LIAGISRICSFGSGKKFIWIDNFWRRCSHILIEPLELFVDEYFTLSIVVVAADNSVGDHFPLSNISLHNNTKNIKIKNFLCLGMIEPK